MLHRNHQTHPGYRHSMLRYHDRPDQTQFSLYALDCLYILSFHSLYVLIPDYQFLMPLFSSTFYW